MEMIGRTREAGQLNKYASSSQAEFVADGRRRVGKTFLINKTLGEQMIFETSGVLMGEREEQFCRSAAQPGHWSSLCTM